MKRKEVMLFRRESAPWGAWVICAWHQTFEGARTSLKDKDPGYYRILDMASMEYRDFRVARPNNVITEVP